MTTVIDLPYPPSANKLHGTRRDGGKYVLPKVRAWREDAAWLLKSQKPEPIRGRYTIKILIKRPDKRRRDISNLSKEVNDLLVRCGVVEDDSLANDDHPEWSDVIDEGCRVILTPVEK